jgi:hypothetical protein
MAYGLPLVCPMCSRGKAAEKRYYGVLKEGRFPDKDIKATKRDTCPNCRTLLIATK